MVRSERVEAVLIETALGCMQEIRVRIDRLDDLLFAGHYLKGTSLKEFVNRLKAANRIVATYRDRRAPK